jgi:hypothetical protein
LKVIAIEAVFAGCDCYKCKNNFPSLMISTTRAGLVGLVVFLFLFSILPITGASALSANQSSSQIQLSSLTNQVKCPDCFAGWGATGPKHSITSVSDSFVVPRVKCSSKGAIGAALVALDGSTANDFASTGVVWACVGGRVGYVGFWESLNTGNVGTASFGIRPGDKISLNITESMGNFVFSLVDSRAKGELTARTSDSGAASNAGGCFTDMAKNPFTGTPYPQANFGTVKISSCLVNNVGVGKTAQTLTEWICVNSSGTKTLATPSKLSGSRLEDFTVSFQSAGP